MNNKNEKISNRRKSDTQNTEARRVDMNLLV